MDACRKTVAEWLATPGAVNDESRSRITITLFRKTAACSTCSPMYDRMRLVDIGAPDRAASRELPSTFRIPRRKQAAVRCRQAFAASHDASPRAASPCSFRAAWPLVDRQIRVVAHEIGGFDVRIRRRSGTVMPDSFLWPIEYDGSFAYFVARSMKVAVADALRRYEYAFGIESIEDVLEAFSFLAMRFSAGFRGCRRTARGFVVHHIAYRLHCKAVALGVAQVDDEYRACPPIFSHLASAWWGSRIMSSECCSGKSRPSGRTT